MNAKWLITAALFLAVAVQVSAGRTQEVNATYADWQKFSPGARAAYLAGIIDTSYAEPIEEQTYTFHRCIQKTPRPLGRLADESQELSDG
jgi:hypothetical protein